VLFTENGEVVFRAVDAVGNETVSEAFVVNNIDKVPPVAPEIIQTLDQESGAVIVTASYEDGCNCFYSVDEAQTWQPYGGAIEFAQDGMVQFYAVDAAGNQSEVAMGTVVLALKSEETSLETEDVGQAKASWQNDGVDAWAEGYDVQITLDTLDGTKQVSLIVEEQGVEISNATAESLNLAVKPSQASEWTDVGDNVDLEPVTDKTPQKVEAQTNGLADVMFGRATGVWNDRFLARHTELPDETAALKGRNIIGDVFIGSDDSTILLLTDDNNGDAFFLDDIFSAFPNGMEAQGRLEKINMVLAGVGDDIVDMTSQRFAYTGGGISIFGGDGNDVIWANVGENLLCGDAGDDRIVGASGNDTIIGGTGNDTMQGGGGDDIFVFGGNWGNDTVDQLPTGSVTLWFEDESGVWDAMSRTYTVGDNSVTVAGTATVNLRFGDDNGQQAERFAELQTLGAFVESVTSNIFKNNTGTLA